jgi:putative FmdB family regulatory protein
MPLYEYECHKCGRVFEVIQKFSDAPLETHEACGGAVERLLSAPAFHFKGSGWYITDYAKKNGSGAKSDNGNNGSPAKPDSSSAKPSEPKAESTSGPKPSASSDSSSKS